MRRCLAAFKEADVGSRFVWDATGRINVLSRVDETMIDLICESGCREVALGVEPGSGPL